MRRKKLSIILALYILIFSVLFTLISSLFQLYYDYKTELKQLHNNINIVQNSYLNSLSNSLWELNEQQVTLLIEGIYQLPYVAQVKIETPFDIRFSKGQLQPNNKILKRSYRLEYSAERDEKNNPYYVGQLEIDYNLDQIDQNIWHKSQIILKTQAIQTFALALFILFITHYLITRHLGKIATFASQLSIDQLNRPLKINRKSLLSGRPDEIDILVNSLESMRAKLEHDLEKNLLLSEAVQQSSNSIFITNKQGNIEFVNSSFEQMSGYTTTEAVGKNMSLLRSTDTSDHEIQHIIATITDGSTWSGEIKHRHKNGYSYWVRSSISPVLRNHQISHFVSVSEDITTQRKAQSEIERLSYSHPITNLPNRKLFKHQLSQLCRQQASLWIILVDLHKFKQLNDQFGQQTGDSVLQTIGQRLQTLAQQMDNSALYHCGIDEFAIIYQTDNTEETVVSWIRRISNLVSQPIKQFADGLRLESNIAATQAPQDGETLDILLRNLDLALQKSKEQADLQYQLYRKEFDQLYLSRVSAENELRTAIKNQEFVLFYQPKINLASHTIEGFEALIRWQHPKKGLLAPFHFIPLAEQSGLIIELGEFIIRQACLDISQINQHNTRQNPYHMAINLSAKQFHNPYLFEQVQQIIQETECDSHVLELELTESMLMTNIEEALTTLRQFKQLGIRLSIDDFGTGYSSLNYLKILPIDTLKIDRSFVKDIHQSGDDRAICSAIIAMAHSLSLTVVAEGIEEESHHDFLQQKHCDLGQGYWYSKPIALDALMTFIKQF